MSQAVTEQIFASKLLSTREKWIIIRHMKEHQLSEEEVQDIVNKIQGEDELIAAAGKEADGQYLARLKNWHTELEKLSIQGSAGESEKEGDKLIDSM
ncbi:MAG: hypothetical protein OEY44_00945 [Candidatus Peregrinibacteria bacterium]|nr:hypothetical protein [Candidatus Peregrinibacteria bacterium]